MTHEDHSSTLAREWGWGLLLLTLGVGARVLFASVFPTQPVSDFRGIIDFALDLRDKSLFAPGYYWDVFNLGPPLVLSLVLRVFPGSPETVSRLATAVWCGLMPLLPFLLWRRALPLWVRAAAGGMLALWPGQVFFSGVVAQDNWVTLPTVALACLAVPPLLDRGRRPHPVAAGLLYALAVAMRQEMLFALVPPLFAAAGFARREGWRPRNVLACALAAGLPFLALAAQRQKATGHFALSSVHGGFTLLGTVVPGATAIGWLDPVSFIASVEPDLVRDRHRMFAEAKRLAFAEVRRRPGFQALRVVSTATRYPFRSETEMLYWSMGYPGTLPEALRARGEAFSRAVSQPLKVELIGLQALFIAAVGMGLARRNGAILVLAAAALLKIGLHSVLVAAGRFYLPATALEILVVALGLWEAGRSQDRRVPLRALAWGAAAAVGLFLASRPLYAHVRSLDPGDEQRTYRFLLTAWDHQGELRCVVRRGRLTALGETEAVIETLHDSPKPGETAVAECTLRQPGPAIPLKVEVLDGYAPGGLPGRMRQRVAIDGRQVVSHDLAAEPGTGWVDAPAGAVGGGQERRVTVEVSALAPDPGVLWGPAAGTRFRLSSSK
ncbi:MAG TPA: glycosyltransferase family 39 protein [Thermoanaerobaculia bacterium]|nr:glycosyltransferase family 39 protein [Thermoanaerobaculia bacterium]